VSSPTTLAAVEDQPRARIAIEAALRDEQALSHAYLFHGPAGSGKRAAARAFAAALIASGDQDPQDAERRVLSGVHPDFTWVEPRGAHEILVDDVRTQVVRQAALRPFEARRRVFVIVDADRMNDESQNALLKTLEEPAPFAHFVLVSSAPGRLLPTIPSRCRPVRFGALPPSRIAAALESEGIAAPTALACARLSGGDADRARALAGDWAEMRAEAEAAARATLAGHDDAGWVVAEPWGPLLERATQRADAAEVRMKAELAERLENEPKRGSSGLVREYETQARRARRRAHTASLDLSLDLVGAWFRDLVAIASGAEDQALNADRLQALREDAAGRDVARLIDCVALCDETRRRLERNVLEDLALEALFDRLRRLAG
jgi:DNA polymerase III subunit delta'